MWSRLVILAQLVSLLIAAENIEGRVAHIGIPSTTTSPVAAETPVLRDGFIPFPDIGAAYKYFNVTRSWNSARKTCIEYNSTLAVIDSRRKIDHVQSIRANNYWGVWIGVHRLFGDAEWVGLKTGLPEAVLPWVTSRAPDKDNLNCLKVYSDGTGVSAALCAELRNFVCEIPLPTDDNESASNPCSTAISINHVAQLIVQSITRTDQN